MLFTAFSGLPLAHTIMNMFINICPLPPLLSLAHTKVYSNVTYLMYSTFLFIIIYALYSLLGLSLAHIHLLTDILYMPFTAS